VAIQDELPKSRLTLTYRTTISGEMQEIALPFRMLIVADLSMGTSKDSRLDLQDRELRPLTGRNLDPVLGDMGISLSCTVKNCIDPENADTIDVQLPITRMNSFAPDQVAQNIPKVRALLTMRALLLEMQAAIDNRRDIKKLVQELYTRPEAMQALLDRLSTFKGLQLPAKAAASTSSVS